MRPVLALVLSVFHLGCVTTAGAGVLTRELVRFEHPTPTLTGWKQWVSYDERDKKVAGLYGLSWALVHSLRNQEPLVLGNSMQLLATRGAAEVVGRLDVLEALFHPADEAKP